MRWIFFHGVFGDWGWENLDDAGRAIAESRTCFESREEAEADAALHGYACPTIAARPSVRDSGTPAMLPAMATAAMIRHGFV